MSDEKKYSAKEAALAVLKKAEEMLKNSVLVKAETGHEKGVHGAVYSAEKAKHISHPDMKDLKGLSGVSESRQRPHGIEKDMHRKKIDELKAMPKPNLPGSEMKKDEAMPAGEIHPKEHMEGEAEKPGKRIESQVAPEDNPKEAQEGNNNEWGTQPATYGTLKLAHFLGRVHTKRGQKSKIVSPDAKAVMDPKNK